MRGGVGAARAAPGPAGLGGPAWARSAAFAVAAALVGVGLWFRVYALGRLPGVNGDEAWYGVLAQHLGAGGLDAWRTPTGNVPGPLQAGALALLHLVFPPSFALLRVPTVIASMAQLALIGAVVRRHLGNAAAIAAVLLTAALPVVIVYARFGWDPSWIGLVAIAAAHLALSGRPWATAIAFALALWVHPTSVFLAPFLVLAAAGAASSADGLRAGLRRGAVQAALLVAALPVLAMTASAAGQAIAWGDVLPRLVSARGWGDLAVGLARLLDGGTVYEYVAGPPGSSVRPWADGATLLAGAVLLAAGGPRVLGRPASREAGLVLGWLATVVAFYLLAGTEPLRPHVERYSVVLVVPTVLAGVTLLRAAAGERRSWMAPVAAGGVAAVLLATSWSSYFGALEAHGSRSHETFWTGPVEPKAEAVRRMAGDAADRGGAIVIADGWWVYWPIRYLAHGAPLDVRVPGALRGVIPAGGVYWVGFPGGPLEAWARGAHLALRWAIPGAGRDVALQVWWAPADALPVSGGETRRGPRRTGRPGRARRRPPGR